MRQNGRFAVCFALALLAPGFARAQGVADFYRGKQLRLIVGHPVGGDYDLGARLLAKYLPKYIPGAPPVVVQNMPGAASVVAANYLYKVAPKDGTTFGSFSRNIPGQAVMGAANLEADPRRFQWLGVVSLPGRICVARADAAVKKVDDLFTRELLVAGGATGSSLSIVPAVLNEVIGTKFHLIEGYNGAPDGLLAMQRGEVEGMCNPVASFKPNIADIASGKWRVLFRAEEAPSAAMPDAPSIFAYAKTDAQKQLIRFIFSSVEFGRPYVAPPETPADRVAALRKAYADALADPELIAEAKHLDLDMSYRSAEDSLALVNQLYATPPAMLEQAKKLAPAEN